MTYRVMTLNSVERIEAKWDGVWKRFALVQTLQRNPHNAKVTILNPAEAQVLAEFIIETLKGEKATVKNEAGMRRG